MNQLCKSVTYGCDPEFVFGRGGRLVPADEVLLCSNRIRSALGTDGAARIGEVRPGFSNNIIDLVAKTEAVMREGLIKFNVKDQNIEVMLAGHYKFGNSIGGHIHINYKGLCTNDHYRSSGLAKYLDFFMEDCLEDLVAPKDERNSRRNSGNYGHKFSHYSDALRTQNENQIEYRAPGSWLVSPNMMYCYLFVAKGCLLFAEDDRLKGVIPKVFDQLVARNQSVVEKKNNLSFMIEEVKKLGKRQMDIKLGCELLEDLLGSYELVNWKADLRPNWGLV